MHGHLKQIRPVSQPGGFSIGVSNSLIVSVFRLSTTAALISLRMSCSIAVFSGLGVSLLVSAQQASPLPKQVLSNKVVEQEDSAGQDLTQGLLDLVPTLDKATESKPGSSPLEGIVETMQRSAALLSREEPQRAVEAQSEVLKLLDDLIKQTLDAEHGGTNQSESSRSAETASERQEAGNAAGESSNSPSSETNPSGDTSPTYSAGRQTDQLEEEPSSKQQTGAPNDQSAGGAASDDTSTSGEPSANEDTGHAASHRKSQGSLADPVALQRGLWGKLPEQSRRAMETQMVERFLPSHRRQIEAYYRILLERYADGQQ